MQLKERINYGYKKVIIMMLISGILSVAIIGVLFANMMRYVEKVQRADTAVKICRVDVNAAARNIREMALNSDTSSYDGYKQKVEDNLAEVDSELKILKKTGIVSDELYQEYASSLSDWGNIGYSIMQQIISGEMENATDAIINQCTPALDQTVEIGVKLDDVTDQASSRAVMYTVLLAIAGISIIVICLIFASVLARKTGQEVLGTILTPLHAIEDVAKELTEGNLHSTLNYHSEDEIGRLAHSMRKSIRILGSYVDDIDRSMKLFSEGNFDAQPEVEWKGDFIGILNSFMAFEKSMADTVTGIQRVSDEVSSGAEQVAETSKKITEEVARIADTLETQTTEIYQINQGIEQINDVVQNNSATSEECAAASQEMSNEAENLRKLIQKFQVATFENSESAS